MNVNPPGIGNLNVLDFLKELGFKTAAMALKENTVSIDGVRFFRPTAVGTILNIHASMNRVFNTSMEIGLKITETDPENGAELPVAHAYFTFVAIDDNGRPTATAPVEPDSDEARRRYEQALVRREARIALGKQLQ